MHVSDRFAKLWETWDARVGQGEDARSFFDHAQDEDLIELLAGESGRDRKMERDIVATEILNRMHRRNMHVPRSADAALASAKASQAAAKEGQADIHASEDLLHAAGQHDLGTRVSASAYASLDAADAAVDAAEQHVSEVNESLGRSRYREGATSGSGEKAEAAAKATARAAHRGSDITDHLERKMGPLGEASAGRAAAAAGQAIRKAADAGAPTDDEKRG